MFGGGGKQTVVEVWQWTLHHNPAYFHKPDEFRPERWLGGDEEFKNDSLAGVTPFSVGPRNCIGKKYVKCVHQERAFELHG